jgi:hypothetical protein
MATKPQKDTALRIAIEITKLYAGSAKHEIGIQDVLQAVYNKLVLLYEDIAKD